MKKVAKLVTFSVTTRVVTDENTSEEVMTEKAVQQAARNLLHDGIFDHLDEVVEDTELPYGSLEKDS